MTVKADVEVLLDVVPMMTTSKRTVKLNGKASKFFFVVTILFLIGTNFPISVFI